MGNLYNPDVRYSFNIPIEEHKEQFVWDPSGSWLECSRICQGKNSAWQRVSARRVTWGGGSLKDPPGRDVVRNGTGSPISLLTHVRRGPVHSIISIHSQHHLQTFLDIPTNSLVINPLPVNPDVIPVNHVEPQALMLLSLLEFPFRFTQTLIPTQRRSLRVR